MRKSAALALAEANKRFKLEGACSSLEHSLTAAQSGTALWLNKHGGLALSGQAAQSVERSKKLLASVEGIERIIGNPLALQNLEEVASSWFNPDQSNATTEIAAGYWLASIFNRGLHSDEVKELTEFLRSGSVQKKKLTAKSVRRYPTGGISEKQALILPPLLMSLARDLDWCSPFLVARKLAHTGGTRDKLAVVPGFAVTDINTYADWDPQHNPVRYFSADKGFCLRDANMYRIRGETGTVAEMGLMASSIMAKQTALPADAVIIDILYGKTAFLGTKEDATTFGEMCATIGHSAGLSVTPMIRKADSFLGTSIGSSTEIVEAAELLKAGTSSEEITTAKRFICQFAKDLNLDVAKVSQLLETAIGSGDAFNSMLEIWRFHGATPLFLSEVEQDIRRAFLGGLHCEDVRAKSTGTISWNPVVTADIVNQKINSPDAQKFTQGAKLQRIVKGGLEIAAPDGSSVSKGEIIAKVYREEPTQASLFAGAYQIK